MVAVYATTAETSVLTLLLKHAQLFTRAKLNQQLVWWKRTSVCEVFLSRAPLRNGGGSTAITQIQIPPKSHKQRCQAGRGPSHPPYNSTRQTGYLEVSGDTSLWIVLSSHS